VGRAAQKSLTDVAAAFTPDAMTDQCVERLNRHDPRTSIAPRVKRSAT